MTTWKAGDLEPALTGTATSAGQPVSLATASTVQARIRRPDGTTVLRDVTKGDQTVSPGSWTLTWQTDDLALAGRYAVELVVTWSNGRPQTFPGASTASFKVQHRLDQT